VFDPSRSQERPIVLTERGDTVTENVLLAAARHEGVTVIRNASPNYMVQDLCFFLVELGVRIEGIGTTTLTVHGVGTIDVDVEYFPSEDPIEAMSLLAAAATLPQAFALLWTLQRACEIQVATNSLGRGAIPIADDVAQKCTRDSLQFDPRYGAGRDGFNALRRLVDARDASYRS